MPVDESPFPDNRLMDDCRWNFDQWWERVNRAAMADYTKQGRALIAFRAGWDIAMQYARSSDREGK